MILCLDVGNSQIFGGVFDEQQQVILRFRYATVHGGTSDQLGIFLKSVLQNNDLDPTFIKKIAICSVVPAIDYSLRAACLKYFSIDPFVLQAGVKTGLKIKYRNPLEVGADRIANAIAAIHYFPGKNIIVVDFGTATTVCAISKDKDYLGGAILPGIRLSMEALQSNTAKLSSVEILKPQQAIGRSTIEGIQSGLYYSQLGVVKEMKQRICQEAFHDDDVILIGTGGFAQLFEKEKFFTKVMPELVLDGLKIALLNNQS
jgi:type III pantothenate kinase